MLAQGYYEELGKIASNNNVVVVPQSLSDVSGMLKMGEALIRKGVKN